MRNGTRRIGIILNSLRAEGTPRLAVELSKEWRADGSEVFVFVFSQNNNDIGHELEAVGVQLIFVPSNLRTRSRYLNAVKAGYYIQRRYALHGLLCMTSGIHSFIFLGAKLAGAPRTAVHMGNFPNVVSRKNLVKFTMMMHFGRWFTDFVICCSEHVRRGAVQQLKVDPSRTRTIYNGIDLEKFRVNGFLPAKSKSRKIVGMVASLEEAKDQETLIRAGKILKDRGSEVEIRLIGDGSKRKQLKALAEQLGVMIEFRGTRLDIVQELAQLDQFAFMTSEGEGLGIALIEALAVGLPVVASDVSACRDVLDSGKLGSLVPYGDEVALADVLEQEYKSSSIADSVAFKRHYVEKRFDAKKMAAAYHKLLTDGEETVQSSKTAA
jgi:glycosyltransferase involved in cell wall biosynthesis